MSCISDVTPVGTARPSLNSAMLIKNVAIACADGLDERKKSSVHFLSEILQKILKQILARRSESGWNIMSIKKIVEAPSGNFAATGNTGSLAIDEV